MCTLSYSWQFLRVKCSDLCLKHFGWCEKWSDAARFTQTNTRGNIWWESEGPKTKSTGMKECKQSLLSRFVQMAHNFICISMWNFSPILTEGRLWNKDNSYLSYPLRARENTKYTKSNAKHIQYWNRFLFKSFHCGAQRLLWLAGSWGRYFWTHSRMSSHDIYDICFHSDFPWL